MSFLRKVKSAGQWLYSKIVKPAAGADSDGDGTPDILEDALALAKQIVEPIGKVDLDGDGRVATVQEIVRAAETTGVKWGKKLLAQGEDSAHASLWNYQDGDLKRYLALARLTLSLIQKYGVPLLPATPVLNGVIEAALLILEK